jgi:NDP-sugar pyrophosphorylase family protein
MMNYGFFWAHQAGYKNFLFNVHHLPEHIHDQTRQLQSLCRSIEISDETQQIMGSGGALYQARSFLKNHDYFLVGNADEVMLPQNPQVLTQLTAHHLHQDPLCTLLTCDHPDLLKKFNGVWVDSHGHVQGFGKEGPRPGLKPVHYTGYKVFSKRILDYLPAGESNIFYDVLVNAISQGERVAHLHINELNWFETGDLQSYLDASRIIADRHMELMQPLFSFYKLSISKQTNQRDEPLIFFNSDQEQIEKLTWSHFACLGQGVKVDGPLHIENLVVSNNYSLSQSDTLSHHILL